MYRWNRSLGHQKKTKIFQQQQQKHFFPLCIKNCILLTWKPIWILLFLSVVDRKGLYSERDFIGLHNLQSLVIEFYGRSSLMAAEVLLICITLFNEVPSTYCCTLRLVVDRKGLSSEKDFSGLHNLQFSPVKLITIPGLCRVRAINEGTLSVPKSLSVSTLVCPSLFPLFPESDESIFINATERQTRVETDRDFLTESVPSLIAQTANVQRCSFPILFYPELDESIFINTTEGQARVETDKDFGTESVPSLIAQTLRKSRDDEKNFNSHQTRSAIEFDYSRRVANID
ncbi:hypothetical protein CDAR_434021 [Caerostris darwini]|uniref:Uncharacterized protein n=1 Tax=Caerostris darwini TaxID=1538125 RepID=A0AAV4S8Y3_9ARAC|nr:hypothetical protein CDAR_434021 [Caerostris darwini]